MERKNYEEVCKERMRFIDFFAGIGGFRKGLEDAGHKCIGFCEFDKILKMGEYMIQQEYQNAILPVTIVAPRLLFLSLRQTD